MSADGADETRQARALWFAGGRRAELRAEPLVAPGPGEVLVRTLHSGLSRGTERLVFEGLVPPGEYERMRGPNMAGAFPFPVKYGYCAVGEVVAGFPGLIGRRVFALHPHQDLFVLPAASVTPLPDALPSRRAVLSANMETALNAIWDSGASAGDRIAVVGAGVLGLLCAFIAARLPGAEVCVVDVSPDRHAVVERLGARFAAPGGAPAECDVVVHASASEAGLATALGCAGLEARVVELSWYGDRAVAAPLGGAFHAKRLRLVSSQVGRLPPARAPRWTYARRMEKAMALLCDDRLDALITEEIAFEALPAELPRLLAPGAPGLTAAIRYS
ncbi:MAG: dehydrogenase [Rhizobiales bacterium 65-9]|nr:zinc-binding alcohol dehydrogenase [Hyphomicrobiales bacterium]OJY34797.1 MAG: dehydrogenase [Rhizobiales bacterium 65-9]